ncbi:uncharacterized protein, partial [Sinocyclocheilus grahami]|uniref:uncharacterized protein n=1 Tax=Sinocyclocheilus grahami TaxID=75366 RepID=UPI0007AD3959
MSDECHLCLLGLIVLSSLLTGSSGVDDAHVFISSGEDVHLPCNNALPDCKSTVWDYYSYSAALELIYLGIKKKDTERHERLSLGPDCSLNIRNISKEDYGSYICRQYVNGEQQGTDVRVDLHVLHVSSSQTEISAGHLCLLGLIVLSSLLTGSSGVDDAHVFISSGEDVRLPCNNALHDCNSTVWDYYSYSAALELIYLGIKKKDTERHERLSLGPDCSLNIRNISKEDYGSYICRQYVNGEQQGTDVRVDLHVLHVSSSQTEISA